MQLPEGYRLFLRRGPRGMIIFGTLRLVSFLVVVVALPMHFYPAWVVAGIFAYGLFTVGSHHVRNWYVSARKVSENPQLVYWAHPTTVRQHLSSDSIQNCRLLTLHLRDGTQFEVGAQMSQKEMRSFIAWLSESNPSIRWGFYDDIGSTSTSTGT